MEREVNLTTSDSIVGTTIDGRYKIQALAGDGRISRVYKADDVQRKMTVSLKFFKDNCPIGPRERNSFRQQAEVVTKLSHPNLVKLYSCESTAEGKLYLITDHVEAITLRDLLKQKGKLPVNMALSIMTQVCNALDHAHSKGIIHGFLTPTNILLIGETDDNYIVKIADMGTTPKAAGNPADNGASQRDEHYLSPEQADRKNYDSRADIYAAGCLLYECLIGRPPFDKSTSELTLESIKNDPIPKIDVNDPVRNKQLQDVMDRALTKSAKQRYQLASDLSKDLTLLLEGNFNDWNDQAQALQKVVPLKPKYPDVRLPVAIVIAALLIPGVTFLLASLGDAPMPEPLMPTKIAVQQQVYGAKDERVMANKKTLIASYLAQGRHEEAQLLAGDDDPREEFAEKYKNSGEKPLPDEEIYKLPELFKDLLGKKKGGHAKKHRTESAEGFEETDNMGAQ